MKVKLEELVEEVSERTTVNNQHPVLTSSRSGIYLQEEYFKKQVASKDNTGYRIIRKGEFTYRAMSDTGEFYPNKLECTDIGIVSPAYPVFKIKDNRILPDYLRYYFRSRLFQKSITAFVQGSTRASMKFGKMKLISIDLPDKDKQNQIINTIGILESIIDKYKLEIDRLNNLIKARFVEMFGDKEEMKISGYIDSLEAGKSLAGTEKCENKVLKTGAVSYDYFDNTQTKYLPKDYQPLNAHKVNPGDVIISRMNTIDLVGAAAYVWNVPDKVYLPDRLWKAKIKNDANPVFVWQTIIHPKTKKLIRRMAGGTSGSMKNISKNKFLEMLVKKATQEEQDQFAAFVAQVDKSKFALSNELVMCNFYVRLINDSITHSRIDLRMSE